MERRVEYNIFGHGLQEFIALYSKPTYIKAFSVSTNREWEVPNFYDPRVWILSMWENSIILATAIVFTLLRIKLQHYYESVAKQYDMKAGDRVRFAESMWKTMFYLLSFVTGCYVVYDGGFFPEIWRACAPFPALEISFLNPIVPFYLTQIGFYVHSIFVFFTMEQKRSDSLLLITHHIITFLLIYGSYLLRIPQIGTLILIVHDFNDIFLEWGKTYVYKKK